LQKFQKKSFSNLWQTLTAGKQNPATCKECENGQLGQKE